MSCDIYRDAISARIDGEDPLIDERLVDAHLGSCPSCREFAETADRVRRRSRLTVAQDVPDLSATVVREAAAADRRSASGIIRFLLALCAVQIAVLSVPDFLASGPDAHSVRHVGAFTLAYAVGLVVVIARPARARTMLHVSVVLGIAIVATTIADVAYGRVPLASEATHLPELVSVVLLWLLARLPRNRGAGSQRRPEGRGPSGQQELRALEAG